MMRTNARIGSQPPSELVAMTVAANKFGTHSNRFDEM
jgi:hypothetical protein